MVYESDFYTTRRPYTRPLASSYTVTGSTYIPISSIIQVRSYPHLPYVAHKRLVTIVHTPIHSAYHTGTPIPIRIHSRVRPSVLAAEYNRIRDLPRASTKSYTERYLNSRDNILFDDETREIRAKADSLLRRIHVFVPRPLSSEFEEEILPERMRSDDYIRRILGARKNVRKEIETLPWYTVPEKRNLGKGNLAAIQYVAGKAHSRRRPYFRLADLKPVDVKSDVNVMSFYSKNREAAAEASPASHHIEREQPRPARAVEPEPAPATPPRAASPPPVEAAPVVEKKKEKKVRKPTPEEEAKRKAEEFLRQQAEEARKRAEDVRKVAEKARLEEERRKAAEDERLRLEAEAEEARIALEKAQEEARLVAIAEELEAQRLETERLAEEKRLEEEAAQAAEIERIMAERAAAEEKLEREEAEQLAAEAAAAAEETRQEEEEKPARPITDEDPQIDEVEAVHEEEPEEKSGADPFVEEPIDVEGGNTSQPEESVVAEEAEIVTEAAVETAEETVAELEEEPVAETPSEVVEDEVANVVEEPSVADEEPVAIEDATSDDIWGDNQDA